MMMTNPLDEAFDFDGDDPFVPRARRSPEDTHSGKFFHAYTGDRFVEEPEQGGKNPPRMDGGRWLGAATSFVRDLECDDFEVEQLEEWHLRLVEQHVGEYLDQLFGYGETFSHPHTRQSCMHLSER